MRYIKVILTIIAVLLALNLLRPVLVRDVTAGKAMDVNIQSVGGYVVTDGAIRIK